MPMSLRPPFGRQQTEDASSSKHSQPEINMEAVSVGSKEASATASPENDKRDTDSDDAPSEDVQAGVKKAQAITITWTKTSLALTLIW